MTAIRDLTEADLPWMAEVERELFGASAWSRDLITEDFRYGLTRYRGLEVDGALAGYAVYGFDGDAFHLMNLAVVSAMRGRGLGRALVEDFMAEARRLGAPDAWLEVAVTNQVALALYRSYGFEDVRVRRKYYQPEGVDALVMRAQLTGYRPAQA
ncbi:ribosomal protein S18-alanine N-acetyltransferase [Demequina sp. SYSU T00039]|uniref:[Ribosomal protein bS18]-alanine N-acetyltransferase n=1 Tax=Demequina lignilytica TaxID=3051663 RepID=A0AAW7M710_9MICO|nr:MULTISPECIES: ribosomal protein S18-alanine N-acetyltransferase [unclassified Demequina]MDN4478149.1 ribosomal protein S18-alanine N-acetyltransferase [Demequina sp. SYSU T00039-1]MDN4488401.1 ribosomal protein S18-alanine N-acetyltransferase [Demequina sp. SYSU T00039]